MEGGGEGIESWESVGWEWGGPISSPEETQDELVRSRGLSCFLLFKINIKEKRDKRKRANDGVLCWRG